MGLLRRKGSAGGRGRPAVDSSLPDGEWFDASDRAFRDAINSYYGSPETMARGGDEYASRGDCGVALLFYRKSIDMLHTAYGFSNMQSRSPSRADASIITGFCGSLETTRHLHPGAPVVDSVREVTHRLRSITTTCEGMGLDSSLYRAALERIAAAAPDVPVDDVRWT